MQSADWLDLWQRLRGRPAALGGLAVVTVLAVLALAAPVIAPHDPVTQYREALLSPP